MNKNQWQYLKPGDIVDIIAPASHCPPEKLQEGIEYLKSIGLVPRIPEDIIGGEVYVAAPLLTQLKHFKEALKSDSKAIWCLRGGYGSMRLIPHLKKISPPKEPKLLIGFSDITSLHLYLNNEWQWPTLHGLLLSQLSVAKNKNIYQKNTKAVLFGEKKSLEFKGLLPLNELGKQLKVIRGKITGGNFRIVQSSIGTDWEVRSHGKILFLEDVGERGYSIDRMLEQLTQAGILRKGIKALIFGDFTEGEEKSGKDFTLHAMKKFAANAPFPVLYGLKAGHGKINQPIPFETVCELELGTKGILTCHYGGK